MIGEMFIQQLNLYQLNLSGEIYYLGVTGMSQVLLDAYGFVIKAINLCLLG